MGWFYKIKIMFYLSCIYLKLLVMYLNPWSNLFLHEAVFFLARKAAKASKNPDEVVDEEELLSQVSLLDL